MGRIDCCLVSRARDGKDKLLFSLKARNGKDRLLFSLKARDGKDDQDQVREPKKSISMGQIQPTGNKPSSAQKPTSLGI